MTATLQFNLPDERDEHEMAVRGRDAFLCLWTFNSHVRKQRDMANAAPEWEWIHKQFLGFLEEHGIDLELVE